MRASYGPGQASRERSWGSWQTRSRSQQMRQSKRAVLKAKSRDVEGRMEVKGCLG